MRNLLVFVVCNLHANRLFFSNLFFYSLFPILPLPSHPHKRQCFECKGISEENYVFIICQTIMGYGKEYSFSQKKFLWGGSGGFYSQNYASFHWDTECSRHSHISEKLKKCGVRDPQNFLGSNQTWAHVRATLGPQCLMLNPVGRNIWLGGF